MQWFIGKLQSISIATRKVSKNPQKIIITETYLNQQKSGFGLYCPLGINAKL